MNRTDWHARPDEPEQEPLAYLLLGGAALLFCFVAFWALLAALA